MNICDLFKTKKVLVSFEVFPPKQISSIDNIHETIDGLAPLHPDYISVTFGAGGSTSKNTMEVASKIWNKYGINALVHLTCVGSSKEQIDGILFELKSLGINNILTLRGDLPPDVDPETVFHDFKYASDLVTYIKSKSDFCISGACYPEVHPQCSDMDTDIENLKRKIDAGVDFLVTQMFFDNTRFYQFREKLASKGIHLPIQVGIMPITNRQSIEKMLKLTNASMPEKLANILDKFQKNQEAVKAAGIAYATDQIIDLLANDVSGIHLYTMNKPEIARKIMSNIGTMVYTINHKVNDTNYAIKKTPF